MATMDILEDLLTIDGLLRDAGGAAAAGRQAGYRQPQPRRPGRLRSGSWTIRSPAPLAGQSARSGNSTAPSCCCAWTTASPRRSGRCWPASQAISTSQRARAAHVSGAAAGHPDRQGLHGGEDRRGAGAPGRSGLRARRQQPLPVAEASAIARATSRWRAPPRCRFCCWAANRRATRRPSCGQLRVGPGGGQQRARRAGGQKRSISRATEDPLAMADAAGGIDPRRLDRGRGTAFDGEANRGRDMDRIARHF